MPIKLKNSSELLVNKEFKISPKGYNGLEVDQLLDQIIKDYELVENNCLLSKQEAESLQKKIDDLTKENIRLSVELDNEKSRWKYIKSDGKDIHIDNLVLLQRIGKLEQIIYERLHINPDELTKNFDPDDY